MKGGKRPGAGRRPRNIDPAELEKLCLLQCTDQDIAGFFGVDVRTIERRKKDPRFAATMKAGAPKALCRSGVICGHWRQRVMRLPDLPGQESARL